MNRSKFVVCLALVVAGALAAWRFMPHSEHTTAAADDWPTSPDGLEWQFDYDDAGRPKGVSGPGGKTATFAYEFHETPAGSPPRVKRVTRTTKSSSVVEEFDRVGRRVSMRAAGGLVKYGYDDFGRLASVERDGLPTLAYEYDTQGRVKRYQIGRRTIVEYSYDFLGRVSAMKTPAGEISYEYQTGQGKVIRKLPNGIRTTWQYEPSSRLTAIAHVGSLDLIAKYEYEYRADDLVSTIRESKGDGSPVTWTYEYDKAQRLVGVAGTNGKSWRYEYDTMGNRLSVSVAGEVGDKCKYDWASRLTEVDGQACEHDSSGNLARATLGGVERRFEFDDDNRLARVNNAETGYQCDGDGSLIVRAVRGERTLILPDLSTDLWRPLLLAGGTGNPQFFVWEGRKPLIAIQNGVATFFIEDRIGSVRCVAEQSGNIEAWQEYTPFGALIPTTDNSTVLRPGFSGLFHDEASALLITRNRSLSANLGRFLQMDPQHRVPQGSQKECSPFSYCGNDPINFFDTTGAAPEAYIPDLNARYAVYKVNNTLNSSRYNDTFVSHSFLALVNLTTGRAERAYSFTAKAPPFSAGLWEDPSKMKNIVGGQAALDAFLRQGKRTAKELDSGGVNLALAMEFKNSARSKSPEYYSLPTYNCKHAATSLFSDAHPLIAAFDREDYKSRSFKQNLGYQFDKPEKN